MNGIRIHSWFHIQLAVFVINFLAYSDKYAVGSGCKRNRLGQRGVASEVVRVAGEATIQVFVLLVCYAVRHESLGTPHYWHAFKTGGWLVVNVSDVA